VFRVGYAPHMESPAMFDHEKLDVYQLELKFLAWVRGWLRVTVTEQNNCGNTGPLLDAEAQQIGDEHESPTS
jgi:hypothetical protein